MCCGTVMWPLRGWQVGAMAADGRAKIRPRDVRVEAYERLCGGLTLGRGAATGRPRGGKVGTPPQLTKLHRPVPWATHTLNQPP